LRLGRDWAEWQDTKSLTEAVKTVERTDQTTHGQLGALRSKYPTTALRRSPSESLQPSAGIYGRP
jgi:hypothetical protein